MNPLRLIVYSDKEIFSPFQQLKYFPNIENIRDFGIDKRPLDYITHNIIISLNKCVQENKLILNEKSIKEKRVFS